MAHFRIDYRLVHANTIDYWCRPLGVKNLIVVDATLASEPLKQIFIKMQCPSDMAVQIVSPTVGHILKDSEALYIFGSLESLIQSHIHLELGDQVSIGSIRPHPRALCTVNHVQFSYGDGQVLLGLMHMGVLVTFDPIWQSSLHWISPHELEGTMNCALNAV